MRTSILLAATALLVSATAFAAENTVTFWVPKGQPLDAANAKVVTLDQEPGSTKLTKACAKSAGQFQRWQVTVVDTGDGPSQILTVVSEPLPARGARIASIRPEGECKEGKTTWLRYSGLIEKGPVDPAPKAKPKGKETRKGP